MSHCWIAEQLTLIMLAHSANGKPSLYTTAAMPIGLPVAILMLAQTYGPAAPPAPKPSQAAPSAEKDCSPSAPDPNTGEIVVCAIKPEGYRLNPDVLEAKREIHNGGRPKPPKNFKQNDCATIGPM